MNPGARQCLQTAVLIQTQRIGWRICGDDRDHQDGWYVTIWRRMRGDDALSSGAALIFREFVAKSADNFAMKRRSGGREFKSTPLHTPVPRVRDIAENRSKSARVRAICDHPRTQRILSEPQIARIGRFLSGRDFARSADHRLSFARTDCAGLGYKDQIFNSLPTTSEFSMLLSVAA
jgi:hypothetical protein